MSFSGMRGIRRGLMLTAAGIIMAAAAAAPAQNQPAYPPGAVVQPLDTGPGAELRRNLNSLAENPNSVAALAGAGRASLDMGDAEAALNFYERADQIAPRDGATKAGMARAMVRLERGRDALPLFAEAVSLGVFESEIAGERGLAWDTIGEPRRAQADYQLALRRRDDPEVRRRLALSLAISGDRQGALQAIDGQLRQQDRAAWRTQAFVLALTGDAAGADRTAESVMAPADARAIAPFLARLAALSPSQKALAVHFGHFPSDGRVAYAQADTSDRDDEAPETAPVRPRYEIPEPVNDERRRPGDERGAAYTSRPVTRIAAAQPPPPPPSSLEGPTGAIAPGFILGPQGPQPQTYTPPVPPPPPRPTRVTPAPPGFDSVAALVQSLPDEGRPPARVENRVTRSATTTTTTTAGDARARRAALANPSRHWVQIAHASTQAALPRQYAEARARAPGLFGSRTPYAVEAGGTNRLLLGPFPSDAAAQAFVNQLDGRHVTAITWTSPAGQEIERLQIADEPRTASTSRSDDAPRSSARGAGGRSTSGSRTSRSSDDDDDRHPPAHGARGRSEPEPGPPARRRRSH
jgi:tetratricopeptide (TPR) repeat protein